MTRKTRRLTRATNTQLPEWRWPENHNQAVRVGKAWKRFSRSVSQARRSFERLTHAANALTVSTENAMLRLRDEIQIADDRWKRDVQ